MLTNKQGGGVAAVVLAAGTSRRMGSTVLKQLLSSGCQNFVATHAGRCPCAHVSEIVLVLGARSDEIKQLVSANGVTAVFNPEYQQGT